MTIQKITSDHEWLKFPAFFNAYPLRNEIAGGGADYDGATPDAFGDIFIDDYYGRIFDTESKSIGNKYGLSAKMGHYVSIPSLEIIDELRVPYRRVPIFLTSDLSVIRQAVKELCASNPAHQILLRGQTRTYLLERPTEESVHFYGEETAKEPSFLPSHLRKNFDPYFLKCMWQSQAAILLNNIAAEHKASSQSETMVAALRNSALFIPFSLGIAQHYGMPSVGLDLTDRLEVACWFATHNIQGSTSGLAATALIEFTSEQAPTVFVFRCPPDAVFNYGATKPELFPNGRPDNQAAWFGHVGWGMASNQLGSYLMCGFRLTSDIANKLDEQLQRHMFPGVTTDPILKHFLTMRGLNRYKGEAKRALAGIYYMSE